MQKLKRAKKEDAKGLAVAASVSAETHYSKAGSKTDAETTSKNVLMPESELVDLSATVNPRSHALVMQNMSSQRIRTSKKSTLHRSGMPKGSPSACKILSTSHLQ